MTRIVLMTGATGSIGTKLRGHFRNAEAMELRLMCLNPNRDPGVATVDLEHFDSASLGAGWAAQFAGVDTVIHLAGEASPAADWISVQRRNVDLLMNVLIAAESHRVRRIVFASSNWVMAGYRHGRERLSPDLPPAPTTPYGHSKLYGECAGRSLARRAGLSFVALRIGWCPREPDHGSTPPAGADKWLRQMWLSDRDLCAGFAAAARVEAVGFVALNLMSDNPGMRWDIDATRHILGYQPQDGHAARTGIAARVLNRITTGGHAALRRVEERLQG